jgi:hypothetical protein
MSITSGVRSVESPTNLRQRKVVKWMRLRWSNAGQPSRFCGQAAVIPWPEERRELGDPMSDLENAGCEACGGELKWHRITDEEGERWLGVCIEYGRMYAFCADEPGRQIDDPLTAFLGEPDLTPSRPAWVRAFRASGGWPWLARWSHHRPPCHRCSAPTVLTLEHPPSAFTGVSATLCLACGEVRSGYVKGAVSAVGWLVGHHWTPPCPAVIRLRRALFTPVPQPYLVGLHGGEENE